MHKTTILFAVFSALAGPSVGAAIDLDRRGILYKDFALLHHNVHRANHTVPDLTWSTTLANSAKEWAQQCDFNHNTEIGGGGYGQNLFAGDDSLGAAITESWYNSEFSYYHYYGEEPDMSLFFNFGHFTQVVWAETKQVGCATVDCSSSGGLKDAGGVPPIITVCNYLPAGNLEGDFLNNVKRPIGRRSINRWFGWH